MKIGARIGDDDFGVTAAQVMQINLTDENLYTSGYSYIRELRDFARVGSLEVPEIPGWRKSG